MPAQLFAGSRTSAGYVDDFGTAARFEFPACIARDDDFLYVTEWVGERVRRIHPGTAEVTTALTLPSGAAPFGIARATNGDWYIACPGDNSIRVYDSAWGLLNTWSTGTEMIWFVYPSDDLSEIYATGHFDDGNATFGSKFYRYDAILGSLIDSFTTSVIGGSSFSAVGGVAQVGSTVYWLIGRNAGRGLYTTGLAPTTEADFTEVIDLPTATGAEGFWAGHQLHPNVTGTRLEVAFGPAEVNGAGDYGDGARQISLPGYTITDPAVNGHAGGTGHSVADASGTVGNYESDYIAAFFRHFVVSSKIALSVGNSLFEALSGPHSIEVLASDQAPGWVQVIGPIP